MSSDRLPVLNRIRVMARRGLFSGLKVVPGALVERFHKIWTTSHGPRRTLLRPLATVLFYRALSVTDFVVPHGRGERLCAVGSRLERTLYWYGENGYEPAEARWWRTLCGQAENVLEIGANIGYYTVVGGAEATRYTAVEANPQAASVIRRNVELNGLNTVEVLECAVVGDSGVGEIELAFPDQEAHSMAPTGSWVPTSSEGRELVHTHASIRVPATPAGPLVAGRDLVKLDIEGAEAEVLGAAWTQILESRPILLVEVLPASVRLQGLLCDLLEQDFLAYEMASTPRWLDRSDLDRSDMDPIGLARVTDVARDVLMVPAERSAIVS